jgi:multiple sugar transport system permease protein
VRHSVTNSLVHIVLLAGAVVMTLPFLWMVLSSLKPARQIFAIPFELLPSPVTFENFVKVWTAVPLLRFLGNTVFISVVGASAQTLMAAMAGYVFARLRFPGRDMIFVLYLATMMLPEQITLIPKFLIIRALGWGDTYRALIVPFLGSPLSAFIMRQAFLDLPVDLEDSARIDGCSRFYILFRVVLPLSMPAISVVVVFTFMEHWNSFLWPLIVIHTQRLYTLQVGLSMLRSELGTNWGQLMAASVITALPILILFFIAQKRFVEGITLTGLKG